MGSVLIQLKWKTNASFFLGIADTPELLKGIRKLWGQKYWPCLGEVRETCMGREKSTQQNPLVKHTFPRAAEKKGTAYVGR